MKLGTRIKVGFGALVLIVMAGLVWPRLGPTDTEQRDGRSYIAHVVLCSPNQDKGKGECHRDNPVRIKVSVDGFGQQDLPWSRDSYEQMIFVPRGSSALIEAQQFDFRRLECFWTTENGALVGTPDVTLSPATVFCHLQN